MTNVNTIASELKAAQDELNSAKDLVERIPALTERVEDLESALIETAKGSAPNIEGAAPEPSTDDAFSGGGNHVQKQELKDSYDVTVGGPSGDNEADHPADAAVEEIKALDDEPTGDMTTPPAPNGGMTGWSY